MIRQSTTSYHFPGFHELNPNVHSWGNVVHFHLFSAPLTTFVLFNSTMLYFHPTWTVQMVYSLPLELFFLQLLDPWSLHYRLFCSHYSLEAFFSICSFSPCRCSWLSLGWELTKALSASLASCHAGPRDNRTGGFTQWIAPTDSAVYLRVLSA